MKGGGERERERERESHSYEYKQTTGKNIYFEKQGGSKSCKRKMEQTVEQSLALGIIG
jgi:hypothetical protein